MGKARIKALKWFFERGEVNLFPCREYAPSRHMRQKMLNDGQLQSRSAGDLTFTYYSLTNKGRRDLHEATRP